jgi:hypothetical protein
VESAVGVGLGDVVGGDVVGVPVGDFDGGGGETVGAGADDDEWPPDGVLRDGCPA